VGGAVCLLLLTVLHTWPLASNPAGLSRNDSADTMLNEWIVSWVAHQLTTDPRHLFDANIFHPHRDTLAYSEPLIVLGIFAAPLSWMGASPVLTYNLLLLSGFFLTGLAMCAAVTVWTGDRMAGVLAGALLAFNAHTLTRLPHLQAIHVEWIPLALWALDRLVSGRRTRDAMWLSLFVTLLALTSGYSTVITLVALGTALAAYSPTWWGRQAAPLAARLALAAAVTVLVVWAVLWPYRRVQLEEGFERQLESVGMFSATPWSYLVTGGTLHFSTWSHEIYRVKSSEVLFPGVTAVGLSLVALFGRRTLSTRDRRFVYLAVGLAGFVLSLGTATPVYGWLYALFPPLQSIRAPARFGYLVLLAVAVLAGIGLAELRRRWPGRAATAIGMAAISLATIEVFQAPFAYRRFNGFPEFYRILAEDPEPGAVVEVPLYGRRFAFLNAKYLLASTQHWRPLLNGYSGMTPVDYDEVARSLAEFPSRETMEDLRRRGVKYIVLHAGDYRDPARSRQVLRALNQMTDVERRATSGDIRLYRLRSEEEVLALDVDLARTTAESEATPVTLDDPP